MIFETLLYYWDIRISVNENLDIPNKSKNYVFHLKYLQSIDIARHTEQNLSKMKIYFQ